jgi:glutaminyl-tRNA synthetase
MATANPLSPSDFIREAVAEDVQTNRFGGRVHTRFPPEPNGYLHIGHTKALCIDFGIAEEFGGLCNLRYDDTNPTKEDVEYVDAIKEDIHWMGFDWGDREYYASDYFEQLYELAEQLIRKGLAYVCDLSPDEIREYRGTLTEPGRNSPYRDRSIADNLDLFRRMRAGQFEEGACTLRAKIDMAAPNIVMRDPVMYRILKASHHRTGDKWCIYPMYDWTHGQNDSMEGVTHSLCSDEYVIHRPLYDWFLDALGIYHPRQIEFSRLNLSHTVLSKRKLRRMVEEGIVTGWNDPRMPTLCGLRRRGFTPEAIHRFVREAGDSKTTSFVDISVLENCVREDLNRRSPRVMAVLRPLKVVIENYPEGLVEEMEAINNPEDPSAGTRRVPFSKVIYIERDDFREDPPKQFFRLAPGREVRLRYAYFVKCIGVTKDASTGEVVELRCTYDPGTHGGDAPDGRKVKATLHWVSAAHAVQATVRLYDRLFAHPTPDDDTEEGYRAHLNTASLETITGCRLEESLANAQAGERFQFERLGYFCLDTVDSCSSNLVFNRTIGLRDTWAKIEGAQKRDPV